MTDTVTRLMGLADKAIEAQDKRLGHLAQGYRQALHDELVRLFTPLSDDEVDGVFKQLTGYNKPTKAGVEFARAVEKRTALEVNHEAA